MVFLNPSEFYEIFDILYCQGLGYELVQKIEYYPESEILGQPSLLLAGGGKLSVVNE